MTVEEQNRPCNQCGAEPGERHRFDDDLARCKQTGIQLIQCGGQLHEFNGREYGEHDGECGPDVWDGEYPGTKQCRELGLFTTIDSYWGVGPDLNELFANSVWDPETERLVYRGSKGR